MIHSNLLDNAVEQMHSLPGIGKKTAFRLVLQLLKRDTKAIEQFSNAFTELKNNIQLCQKCHILSDTPICHICSDTNRDHATICIVEDIKDVMAIENTHQFRHVYHVLGGIISPMNGIGPQDLNIETLTSRLESGDIQEVIFALSTTMEGDTTSYFIYRKIKNYNVKITTIAKGVSIGDEIEYIDEVTLGRSIKHRQLFELNM